MDLQQELTERRNMRYMALLEPIYGDCQRWAYHLTQNLPDAEDVLADAVMAALEKIDGLRNDGAFKTWMFRIIANTHRMSLRRKKRPLDAMDPGDMDRVASGGRDQVLRDERVLALRHAMQALAPEQREALWLFHVQGLSSKEVSAILGKQEGTVRVLLTRARDRLGEQLRKSGIDESILDELK